MYLYQFFFQCKPWPSSRLQLPESLEDWLKKWFSSLGQPNRPMTLYIKNDLLNINMSQFQHNF
jgi:hypothetical protein